MVFAHICSSIHIRLLESSCPLVRPFVRLSLTKKYRIIDSCTIHVCIRVKDRRKLKNASYMHVSGSRVMDKCIIGRCIMVTCIRIKKISIAHAYYKHQESYIHTCFRIKVQYHRCMQHTHMHHSQRLRKVDKCIIHG